LCCLFPAELKILDDPLPFKKSKEKLDKEEEAAIQDVSTEVRFSFDCFSINLFLCNVMSDTVG
jgi:hypothetical protein